MEKQAEKLFQYCWICIGYGSSATLSLDLTDQVTDVEGDLLTYAVPYRMWVLPVGDSGIVQPKVLSLP